MQPSIGLVAVCTARHRVQTRARCDNNEQLEMTRSLTDDSGVATRTERPVRAMTQQPTNTQRNSLNETPVDSCNGYTQSELILLS